MTNIVKTVFYCLILIFSTNTYAVDRGRWLCPSCYIGDIKQGEQIGVSLGEVVQFIKTDINPAVKKWTELDTVTVCNGANCISVFYRYGAWFALGPSYRDTRAPYMNGNMRGVSFSGDLATSPDVIYMAIEDGEWKWVEVCTAGACEAAYVWVINGVQIFVLFARSAQYTSAR